MEKLRFPFWKHRSVKQAASDAPIIIGGFYRTGSSLFRRLLDAHSRVYCGPEVKFFQDLHNDYIDDPYVAIRFFTTIQSLGLNFDEIIGLFGPPFVESHVLAARKQGKKRWADKSPDNVLYLDYWKRLLDDRLLVVHTVRNPLDVLASLNEVRFIKTVPEDFQAKVEMYDRYLDAAFSFAAENPNSVHTLRYEDLVLSPEDTLQILLPKLGENFEPQMLSDFYNEQRQCGIEDPKVRTTVKVHSNSIDRWKKDLTPGQIKLATYRLKPWMIKLGYQTQI